MITAFPELFVGQFGEYYFKIQFPEATLGALFDSLSFFVTLHIIKKALTSRSASHFIGHLPIDLVIALLATLWVLFVFSFSSWLIRYFDVTADIQELASSAEVVSSRPWHRRYERRRSARSTRSMRKCANSRPSAGCSAI